MKQKKQTEKKLSLKKLQMVRISNPKVIRGGNDCSQVTTMLNLIDDDGGNTGTVGTSRKD
ncbi:MULTISPECIES: hypothetical protein [unclassified Chryseobacterium]|uniref:hypothetical protein n=1 Tax=unclassified Chryseobacterium TaxID=2593645 RepID=UPI00301010BF